MSQEIIFDNSYNDCCPPSFSREEIRCFEEEPEVIKCLDYALSLGPVTVYASKQERLRLRYCYCLTADGDIPDIFIHFVLIDNKIGPIVGGFFSDDGLLDRVEDNISIWKKDILALINQNKSIYKITHTYSVTEQESRYIETVLSAKRVADIVTGLQFYLEDNSKHGMKLCITEDMASYLLCNFFYCRAVKRDELCQSGDYEPGIDDIPEQFHIDLYTEREARCGEDYQKYEVYIELIANSSFIKSLCSYFDDDTAFKKLWDENAPMLSLEEILQNY